MKTVYIVLFIALVFGIVSRGFYIQMEAETYQKNFYKEKCEDFQKVLISDKKLRKLFLSKKENFLQDLDCFQLEEENKKLRAKVKAYYGLYREFLKY